MNVEENPLLAHLRRRIETTGPLSVADYMAEALGHPRHGYYVGRDPLGADGDFVTAPEISQMFGELLGLWCAIVWGQMGTPAKVRLVELGPGRGTLMADVLRAARAVPPFLAALEVHLVEISPALRARQEQALAEAGVPLSWHDTPEQVPDGPLIVLANEFFDALPVRQFQRLAGGWHERMIDLDRDGALGVGLSPAPSPAARILPPVVFDTAPVDAVAEVCPRALAVMRELAGRVVRSGGAVLAIDYGHGKSAPGDTVQAVKAHAFHPILDDPGCADITAHVDFEMLAQEARRAGAQAFGPVTQGDFLRGLGIETRAAALAGVRPDHADEIETAMRRLIADEEMGTLFKVLAVIHPRQDIPPGY